MSKLEPYLMTAILALAIVVSVLGLISLAGCGAVTDVTKASFHYFVQPTHTMTGPKGCISTFYPNGTSTHVCP